MPPHTEQAMLACTRMAVVLLVPDMTKAPRTALRSVVQSAA